ncbi:hypothetical protein BJ508DRAFT_333871 [Ascobolus immersus RN42]|uniref:Uncharacterized protein n=1 Tax=Ascobolus immersus RN42 TaxID=1160509 RepID=A0A3N4HK28_ASCIM|nr:hypothetical protein BJ508DRAFT_333871 [Ascobolus immersus RN42]
MRALPDVHGPDVHGPDVHGPDAHGPDVHGPDAHGPDAHGPDVHGPDVHGPDAHGPDGHGPDAHGPDVHGPDGLTGSEMITICLQQPLKDSDSLEPTESNPCLAKSETENSGGIEKKLQSDNDDRHVTCRTESCDYEAFTMLSNHR